MILHLTLDTYSCARLALQELADELPPGQMRNQLLAARADLTDAFHAYIQYGTADVPALLKRQAG